MESLVAKLKTTVMSARASLEHARTHQAWGTRVPGGAGSRRCWAESVMSLLYDYRGFETFRAWFWRFDGEWSGWVRAGAAAGRSPVNEHLSHHHSCTILTFTVRRDSTRGIIRV